MEEKIGRNGRNNFFIRDPLSLIYYMAEKSFFEPWYYTVIAF